MIEDTELLRRYAEENSEAAFTELVQRRIGLVYAVALRRTGGDVQRAEDAAQKVFVDLARKAGALSRRPVLAGWLHRSAQFAASDVMRADQRWHAREREAHLMHEIERLAPEPDWERLRPLLDELLNDMDEGDRDAILLRFFDGRPFAEIGDRLRLTENAARMRVERGLDKLRALLERRGVTSTTAALAVALASQPIVAAPAGLAASVTGAALASGGAALAGTAAKFMSITKIQLGISGALVIAGAAGWGLQTQSNARLREEAASLRRQNTAMAALRVENTELKRTAAELADFRNDDAQLSRLSNEAVALKVQLEQVTRAEQTQAAAASARAAAAEARLDQQPRPVFQARPQYPLALRQAGVAGTVLVDFIVNTDGDVHNVRAVSSTADGLVEKSGRTEAVVMSDFVVSGQDATTREALDPADAKRLLEASAIEAVSQWKFAAGRKGGRSVNTRMRVPIVFVLPGAESGQR